MMLGDPQRDKGDQIMLRKNVSDTSGYVNITGFIATFSILLALTPMLLTVLWNRYGAPEFRARKTARHRLSRTNRGRHSTVARPGFYPQRVPQSVISRFQGLTSTIQHHAAA